MLLNGVHDPGDLPRGKKLLVSYGGEGRGRLLSFASSSVKPRASTLPGAAGSVKTSGKGTLRWPVSSGRLVSKFGPRNSSFHDGLDIASPTGTPVIAAHSGTVIYSDNELSGYGNLVIIRGDDRLLTIYAHNSRMLVKKGERVAGGQKIAEVGETGHASGPHLHFEVRMKDRMNRTVAIDPMPLLQEGALEKPRYRVNESLTPLFARFLR
jgi:murein DD-endopeptidase MepM/ murein hydrolase activator NlpD